MGAQIFLVLPGRSDPNILKSSDLILDHLFLFADMVVLLLTDETDPVSVLAQTKVRVVLPEQQSVLGAGGHHSVGLSVVLCHQIVDQYADIGF